MSAKNSDKRVWVSTEIYDMVYELAERYDGTYKGKAVLEPGLVSIDNLHHFIDISFAETVEDAMRELKPSDYSVNSVDHDKMVEIMNKSMASAHFEFESMFEGNLLQH